MQFASFDLRDPCFEAFDLRCSVQLVTLENLYGLDPKGMRIERKGDAVEVHASGLTWAGRQQRSPGEAVIRFSDDGNRRVRVTMRAHAPEPIRCVKLLLRDLGEPAEAPEHGRLWSYPKQIPAPLICERFGDEAIGVRAEDPRVREKRFAAYRERFGEHAGRGVLELIHEESAPDFATSIESPPFVVTRGAELENLESEHTAFLEGAHGLVPWPERRDVPTWARELRLVVALHGMHWTGRAFLTYAEMLEILRFVAERIDGRHVLAYLPGWEGRYYWQYGDYRPEPRLGGEAGFAELCDEARELASRVFHPRHFRHHQAETYLRFCHQPGLPPPGTYRAADPVPGAGPQSDDPRRRGRGQAAPPRAGLRLGVDITMEDQPVPISTIQPEGQGAAEAPPMTGCHQPSEVVTGTEIPFAWFAQGLQDFRHRRPVRAQARRLVPTRSRHPAYRPAVDQRRHHRR